jgi:ATP-dependent Clp protease protease subunit
MQIKAIRAHKPGTARRLELVKASAEGGEDSLYVYGTIGDFGYGDGVSAKDFAAALNASTAGKLRLRINSPGGDVFEGVAMAQAMREYKGEVVAQVDGIAASAATFLTTAAAFTVMAPGSMLMVHRAWTIVGGNAEDLLKQATVLQKIDGQIAQQYADRTGLTADACIAWMDAETWFTEAEAVEAGLADSVIEKSKTDKTDAKALAAAWNVADIFKNAPALGEPEPETTPEPPPAVETAPPEYHDYERVQRLARVL